MFGINNKTRIKELEIQVKTIRNRAAYYEELYDTLREDFDKARSTNGDLKLESPESSKLTKGLNIADDNDNFYYYEFRELMNLKSGVEADRYAKLCIFLTATACNQNNYIKRFGDSVNYLYVHENQLKKIFYNSVDANLDILEQYGVIERLREKDTEGKIYIKALKLTTIPNQIPMELNRAECIFRSMTGRGSYETN